MTWLLNKQNSQNLRKVNVFESLAKLSQSEITIGKTNSTSLGNPDAVDADGLLMDVDVQPITENNTKSREDRTQDIKEFFHPTFEKTVQGKSKKFRKCKKCP